MALVIDSTNRNRFAGVMREMYALRYKVFVEQMGWTLPGAEGGLEKDQFDDGQCFHLVTFTKEGRVAGAQRLTPTREANLACDILGPQLGVSLPREDHIVEATRLCVQPDLSEAEHVTARTDLSVSTQLLSLREGWSHTLIVGYGRHILPFIRNGYELDHLSAPQILPGDREPSFAYLAHNPNRAERTRALQAQTGLDLQDPATDEALFAQFSGERAA